MGAKAEMLAKQFEAKVAEATAVLQKLGESDWTRVTEAEKWTVGVTAHHVAASHEPVATIVKAVASGQAMPPFTMAMLEELNAQHAKEHAGCTKAETIALHERGAAAAAAAVRGLSDEQLAMNGTVLSDAPRMTVEQIVTGILIHHVDDHFGSIRRTVGM